MSLGVLETDEHGNVVAKPVSGWCVTTVQGVTVLVGFEYVDSPSGLDTENRKRTIQLELKPEQSSQLATALTEVMSHLLPKSSENAPRSLLAKAQGRLSAFVSLRSWVVRCT